LTGLVDSSPTPVTMSQDIESATWSQGGGHILALTHGKKELIVMDPDGSNRQTIKLDAEGSPGIPAWGSR
ncbi:MAG: hypothetical protein ABJA81_01290, partial [Nocardioidaceae bacterium]